MTITDKDIEERVESWNWNASIFEIYEELKEGFCEEDKERLLTRAYHYFGEDKMIMELASEFGIYNIDKSEDENSPIPC